MNFGLDQSTINRILSVFSKHAEIEQVLIYGSRAKGNFRKGSDIDLTMIGKNLTEQALSSIKSELDELNTPYLFDISIFDQLHSPDLEEHIARIGQVFYQSVDNKIHEILGAYPSIKLAILFGSLANNSVKFESDLDLAVQSDRALTKYEKLQLIEDLAQYFMRPIDLIDLHEVGEPLLGQIIAKGRRILGSDTYYGHLLARHLYVEADFMPYQRRILKERRDKWIGS